MRDETPVQEWYPRARVTLLLRFEEFGSKISAQPPATKQSLRKGTSGTKELEWVPDPDAPSGVRRYLLQPKGGSKISAASADKLTHGIGGIIPQRASHTRNGLDKADTLSLEIAFTYAPFDPRCIRSCAVEYFLGTVSPETAALEQTGVVTWIPDTFRDIRGNTRSNKRFVGWADTWEITYKEGSPIVRLECRDNRSVLIDQPAPPQLHLNETLPLDKAVADYLSNFPQFAGIGVEWRGAPGEEAPKLSGIIVQKGIQKGTQTGHDKQSVMDYLTDLVGAAGCILLMEETVLVISRPRTVLAAKSARSNDPHRSAERSINGMRLPNRSYIYGYNVKDMQFGRKLNAAAPTNFEVRAYVPKLKQTIVARFPDVTTTALPGDKGSDKKWSVLRVQGVSKREDLRIIAQSAYEQQGRQELTVDVTTHDMASFGGDNMDPDVLDQLPGDSFDVYVMKDALTDAGRIESQAAVRHEMEAFITGLGFDYKLAEAYASCYSAAGFQTTFRTRVVKTDWTLDGVSVSVSGSNYIEVRLDKEIG